MIFIFTGPTISGATASAVLDANYLGPAAQGDVYRAALQKPEAIGIIDGLFEKTPSIWHKEILWALEKGIRVYGSSSMGALRAAELSYFGMIGVGSIYEGFRDGTYEDDDEVTMIHGPEDSGYIAMSEPLVNIRATLAEAVVAGVIDREIHDYLVVKAKRTYYQERNYKDLCNLDDAPASYREALSSLIKWTAIFRIDQKRRDAIDMLLRVKNDLQLKGQVLTINHRTERTIYWERMRQRVGASNILKQGDPARAKWDLILDEIRLDPTAFRRIQRESVLRYLCLKETESRALKFDSDDIKNAASEFLGMIGMSRPEDVSRWVAEVFDSQTAFLEFIGDTMLVNSTCEEIFSELTATAVHALCAQNEFHSWAYKAIDKYAFLRQNGLLNPDMSNIKITKEEIIRWYFESIETEIPNDIKTFAYRYNYNDEHQFMASLIKHYIYMNRP